MQLYEVLVAHKRATKLLTYRGAKSDVGQVVQVSFGSDTALGIVMGPVKKPEVRVKNFSSDYTEGLKLPLQLVKLLMWLRTYYPSNLGILGLLVLPKGLSVKESPKEKIVISSKNSESVSPNLREQQQQAVDMILGGADLSYLLHGITGSGKTRIYEELIRHAADEGKSSILLSPEIGLTAQLQATMAEALPNLPIHVFHSDISPAKRRQEWQQIAKEKGPQLVLGPRSALFAPVSQVGFIIMDEAHDSSYKQQAQPYYQTSRVAAHLARLHRAKFVLGSATPSISDYYVFQTKKLPIIGLTELAKKQPTGTKAVKVIDIKQRSHFDRSAWLSEAMLKGIDSNLQKAQQSLVFLNRRGTARLTLCESCGWQAICPHCDIPLTFHGDLYHLICHICDFKQTLPSSCPVCQATNLVFRSIGTKFIVEELARLFPDAHIKRFDSDVKKSQQLAQQYQALVEGSIDIIVGTQVITKGWDLPKLGFVGIVMADSALFFPDFTAQETAYQLLHQATGRTHRGHIAGQVVIQTYQPDSQVIKSVLENNYQSFYEQQLDERRRFGYPPFVFMLKLWVKRAKRQSSQSATDKLASALRKQYNMRIEILGPAPAFQERSANGYTWQIVIKARQRQPLLDIISQLPSGWSYDIDPVNLL